MKSGQSTKVLREFDIFGRKTVSVMTKIDLCSEKMITQLTLNDISHSFSYALVKNDIRDDNYNVINGTVVLSRLDKSHFGLEIVVQSVVRVMLSILFKPQSLIINKVDLDLAKSVTKKNNSKSNDIYTFTSNVQRTLNKLFIYEDYSLYREDEVMHAYPMLCKKLDKFYYDLQHLNDVESKFLEDEIKVLDTHNGRYTFDAIFKSLLSKRLSKSSKIIDGFVTSVWSYISGVVRNVLFKHAKHYDQQLSSSLKTYRIMIEKMQISFKEKVVEIIEMEKTFCHSSNPDKHKVGELKTINVEREVFSLQGSGDVKVGHLKKYSELKLRQAFELKMSMDVYWEIVVKRFVDYFALNLLSSIKEMVTGEMIYRFMDSSTSSGEAYEEEDPLMQLNRENLTNRINYLMEIKNEIEEYQKHFEFLM
ncbi:dynamin-related protein 4C-like [Rutidosis leptorrhynchoides]|uniref:dynamin-related protein 4C-like n=1 Tax=Rutidosis leptorrhynchoides TaxID=125765 RepID=UPI003A9A22C3